jgi:hypothetical protein
VFLGKSEELIIAPLKIINGGFNASSNPKNYNK